MLGARFAWLTWMRIALSSAWPALGGTTLAPPCPSELRANYPLASGRELGALNIGGAGNASASNGQPWFELANLDCLYLGRDSQSVEFASKNTGNPAVFYLLSYPAHALYPPSLVRKEEATPAELGSSQNANHRFVCKYIHMQGARSCQLVMGVTHLGEGSVWNTMPPHTHMRRSEIYMYFNLEENDRVFHLMGVPDDTRHLVVANRGIAVSPPWSIHCGAGTHAYSFCWGMGGENQDYADMDPVGIKDLR